MNALSEVKWNKGQLEAIESDGATTLVSAAAGSGKTAVLVERIIRKITRETDPCNIEDFLIVTFTRAAASQMKDKIYTALSEKIEKEPDNKHLKECKFKLPFANISTIDSFCIGLVRDNFNAVGISPDFSVIDNAKNNLLKRNALDKLIEEFHDEYPDEFRELNETVNNHKNDKATQNAIQLLYKESRAHTFPDDYLDSLIDYYESDESLSDSEIGKEIFSAVGKTLKRYLSIIKELKKAISEDDTGVKEKYEERLDNDEKIINNALIAVNNQNWDEIKSLTDNAVFDNNNGTKQSMDKSLNGYVKDVRNEYINTFTKKKLGYFEFGSEDYKKSKEKLLPIIKTLIAAVKRYGEILSELKTEENSYYYDDIMHFTIGLLLKKENGKIVKTDTAVELSGRYKEIFVDEYQDVNAAQDSIFEALSDNDKNRFLVGDVKQCIYTFRQAMPEVFTGLRDETPDIKKVYLNYNYRSRKEITDTVNFIFRQIMTKETGDIDYDEREYLNPGAPFTPDGKTKVEFNIIDKGENSKDTLRNQAYYIADRILDSINNKEQIVNKINPDGNDTLKDMRLSDYCILYRKKVCVKIFGEVFDELVIPYISDNEDTFISSPEICFLKSLLKIIDNPTDDVSLAAIMISPVFGFSPEELALIRAQGGKGSFYKCVCAFANQGNQKAADFIDSIAKLRRIASTRSAGEFTADIIDETGYRAIVSKMSSPFLRLANINSFINLADNYEQTGTKGISAFVRFLSKLNDEDVKSGSNSSSTGSDCVRMMTIHKSKGLEFPVVVMPNTERMFNLQDTNNSLIVSKKYGIGMKYIEDNIKYSNLIWKICSEDKKRTIISEEIRLAYVALTRAKERIIILSSDDTALSKLSGINPGEGKIDSGIVSGMNTYNKMIGSALLSHPDSHKLRIKAGNTYSHNEKCDTRIDFNIIESLPEINTVSDEISLFQESDNSDTQSIYALRNEIENRLSYKYPFESLNKIRAKSTASNLGIKSFDKRYFALSKPRFAMDDKLSGAQIGTATHRFMQYCNLERAKTDIDSEMRRQTEEGILSEKEYQSLDKGKISKFFETPVFERLLKSPKIYREFSFNALLPVNEIYPDTDLPEAEDEIILIEGVVDCAFEENGKLVIIDFKTDRASDEKELIEEYSAQLDTYRKCMSKVLNIPVSETVIYSFALGKTIPV